MIHLLRALFLAVLLSMISVTAWAGLHCPLFGVPRLVATHPWFIATIVDAYSGFITFYVWVCYRESAWTARVAWFLAIMSLGNIAMASYCLAALSGTSSRAGLGRILAERRPGPGWLGICLAALGVTVTVAAYCANPPQ
ncbi:MAG: DUF1475 family protein [Opitutaceae bacterium]|jgi:hypothetical protein